VRNVGDVDGALAKAAKVVEADYHIPHLVHVPMEPPVAVARVENGTCEVWAPTQNPRDAATEAAWVLGIAEDKVKCHVTFLGSGFGRKSKADFISEAAWLAKQAGVPVRVQWTREDDVQHDSYHSVSAQKLSAGLDAQGKVIAWRHRMAFPPIFASVRGSSRVWRSSVRGAFRSVCVVFSPERGRLAPAWTGMDRWLPGCGCRSTLPRRGMSFEPRPEAPGARSPCRTCWGRTSRPKPSTSSASG
jgi:hypothetical protein